MICHCKMKYLVVEWGKCKKEERGVIVQDGSSHLVKAG